MDLAGWRRERLPAIPDEAYFTLAPDWVCEVLSPSTERLDRTRKLRVYAEAGVAHAWLVKPTERMLEVLRLRDGAWTILGVYGDDDVVRVAPFEAIELGLRRLWPDAAAERGRRRDRQTLRRRRRRLLLRVTRVRRRLLLRATRVRRPAAPQGDEGCGSAAWLRVCQP